MAIDTERFRRDGYLHLKGVFTSSDMAAFNREADACQEARGRGENLGEDLLANRYLRRIMLDGRILAAARSLLNATPIYFGDGQFVVHKPNLKAGTYHKDNVDRLDNDGPDWRGEYNLVRFGVYLEPHRGASGGLLIQAGSHKGVASSRLVEVLKEEVVRPLTFKARYLGVELGDAVVWNLRATHAGMGRYLKPLPFIPVTERNGCFLPEALKSSPVAGQRRAVFFTLGAAGPHMDRYIAYLKTRGYQVETWKTSPYGEAEMAEARGKDIQVRDMHAEIAADIAGGPSRGAKPEMAAATVLTPKAGDAGVEIVCGCFDLTRAELERAAASSTFEQFLEDTRAGSRCSACLLDVEYLFVHAPKTADATRAAAKREARLSLKRRLYAVLDRVSPLVPFRLVNTVPLLSGAGIVQRLWLVNQPLVFGEDVAVPPHRFDVVVRDGEGRELGRARHDIPCGETRIIPLPELPKPEGQALAVGSVEVARHGLKPGVRGTTRPHFELEAARSNTVLHVQGAGPDPEAWLTTVHEPRDTRILFTAVNTVRRPFAIDFDVAGDETLHVEIPPFGARVVEPVARAAPGQSVTYHYRGRGRGKVHVLATSPGLDRIAIDHL